ncbi:MAG: membrane protein insertase YidC, partial [Planctomycetes bacterium]|nr:membrane protein insertase YidC [Planctomycetota bacterium]
MKMQKLAPMMQKIKEKYADDKEAQQREMMKFYKQHGAGGFLGWMPMMLQMPVWIALWTSINISFELRGAEFLPFWITDLSVPDALIPFKAINLPIFGEISSFNLLPILMGVVMYFQQKLMPHSSAAANPQAAQQQKMMQIMMPLMFPIMLYKGPSGVNLYILSSITAGVFEQMIIRKHIREKEEDEGQGLVAVTSKTGGKVKKKKPKPFYKG